MAEFDVLITGGTIVDGTRLPRYRADVGIKDGRVAAIGNLSNRSATRVLDATGKIVAPGFIDAHTHLDGQIFWDPYCTTGGWHGVTTVALGNCGFGFAPVKPTERERAMLAMSRNEQIPFPALQAGLPWDWESYPEYLDSLDRTPKGVNCLSYVPISPLMVYVMGLDKAKSGEPPTEAETLELQRLLHEALEAGAAGWSVQRGGPHSMQADYDGSPFPTDVMGDELCLSLAEVSARFDHGSLQHSPLPSPAGDDNFDIFAALKENEIMEGFSERLAEVSGRPVIHNAIQALPDPTYHRDKLRWLEECHSRGNRVIAQATTFRARLKIILENNNLFDGSLVWRSILQGPRQEQLARLKDPEVVAAMVADQGKAAMSCGGSFAATTIVDVGDYPEFQSYIGRRLGEVAEERGEDPAETVINLSVATDFAFTFQTDLISGPPRMPGDGVAEIMSSPFVLAGASDGGAHAKMFVGGNFGTDMIMWLVRDEKNLSLEEAHFHLSYLPAEVFGLKDRGAIREGAWADIVVYDLEGLQMVPEGTYEKVEDQPGGEWRLIQRCKGISYTLVNGEVTFEDGECTGATPGQLLRKGLSLSPSR